MKTIIKVALLVYCLGVGGAGMLGNVLFSMESSEVEFVPNYKNSVNFTQLPVRPPYPRQR